MTALPGKMTGRDDNVIELSGVNSMASISGCTMLPPPPSEYAVEPVGVAINKLIDHSKQVCAVNVRSV